MKQFMFDSDKPKIVQKKRDTKAFQSDIFWLGPIQRRGNQDMGLSVALVLWLLFLTIALGCSAAQTSQSPESLNEKAQNYYNQGNYPEAEQLFQQVLSLREKSLGPNDPNVATNLNNLAESYRVQGKYPEAEALFRRRRSDPAKSPRDGADQTCRDPQ